jgi:hypothetical protein
MNNKVKIGDLVIWTFTTGRSCFGLVRLNDGTIINKKDYKWEIVWFDKEISFSVHRREDIIRFKKKLARVAQG